MLKGLKGFLGLLHANRLLDRDAGLRVLQSFTEQWDAFHATFARMLNPGAAVAATPVIVPPPPAPAAPSSPPPAPASNAEGADEDEEDEGEEDEEAEGA